MSAFELLLHATAVLLLPPLVQGVINRTKAVFAGRRGPPILQLLWDLRRLLGKGVVLSKTTSWVFLAGPVVNLVGVSVAASFVPLATDRAPLAFEGDLFVFAYLLTLGRFFTLLAALDTGSAFEGMGAARDATWAALAEPALFLGLLAMAKTGESLSMSGILGEPGTVLWGSLGAPHALVLVAIFIVLLAENCRIPFDDPTTHLELTMIHEVTVLDHSGPPLALALWAASIKLFLFAAIIVRTVIPVGLPMGMDWLALCVATLLVAVLVGIVESTMARLRLVQVPRLLLSACLLSGFGLVLVVR